MTIIISEGITLTATKATCDKYIALNERLEELERWEDSAFDERDWEDYEAYNEEYWKVYDELLAI